MPLDLLVPDLLVPVDAPPEMRALRLPALETWLARADIEHGPARSANDWLAGAFSLPVPAPVAPVALAAESRIPDGAWLRADPVHLRIDRGMAALVAPAVLNVTRAEADALLATLQAHFREDGLEFLAPAPQRWYVRVPEGAVPATTPLAEALASPVNRSLPDRAAGNVNWPAVLTETQMLLATHDVNLAREGEGRPTINSVWFWGGGELPSHVASPYASVYADEVFVRGLATVSQARLVSLPPSLDDMRAASRQHHFLVALDSLTDAMQCADAARWLDGAHSFERQWFERIAKAIERFDSVRIVLPRAGGTLVARLGRGSRWRLFRARKALAAYA